MTEEELVTRRVVAPDAVAAIYKKMRGMEAELDRLRLDLAEERTTHEWNMNKTRETLEALEMNKAVHLAELERLRAENAAMRPIVEAVADRAWYTHSSTLGGELKQYACCTFEECEQESDQGSQNIQHTPECPVTQARALLAQEDV